MSPFLFQRPLIPPIFFFLRYDYLSPSGGPASQPPAVLLSNACMATHHPRYGSLEHLAAISPASCLLGLIQASSCLHVCAVTWPAKRAAAAAAVPPDDLDGRRTLVWLSLGAAGRIFPAAHVTRPDPRFVRPSLFSPFPDMNCDRQAVMPQSGEISVCESAHARAIWRWLARTSATHRSLSRTRLRVRLPA